MFWSISDRLPVSQLFVSPAVRTRAVLGEAVRMQGVLAYFALEYVFMLLDVPLTPRAQVWVDERTRPFVTMGLKVARME